MSYCRWSSMNYMCDVYTYAHVYGGYMTHVASNRKVMPPIPELAGSDISVKICQWSGCELVERKFKYKSTFKRLIHQLWIRASVLVSSLHHLSYRMIPSKNIGLPFDGQTFTDDTPEECAERLEWLRAWGYKVPQYAIDRLRSEIEE